MCVALPGRITAIEEIVGSVRVATLDVGGVIRRVRLDYLPQAQVGDHVVVSMGFATGIVEDDAVAASYDALSAIRDLSPLSLPRSGPA